MKLHAVSYDRVSEIPHDLVHYVAESQLGLHRGYWGSIAAGVLFDSVRVVSGKMAHDAKKRSEAFLRGSERQGVEAEVYVSLFVDLLKEGKETNTAAIERALRELWRPEKPSRPLPTVAEVQATCTLLKDFQRRWDAVKVGEGLTVQWKTKAAR